eukprot:TRINITY_DN10091_c0_g1_i2.p1 TRINITY_DN10091_c0_g1~~TRINITY_DN10091_c0_g1_i2.p1  ORF type:complete len:988 (-),score=138.44 TRINITY_DN10091_c0_g1_i2:73-3036(-)
MSVSAQWRPVSHRTDFEYVPPHDVVDEDLKCGVCLDWPVDPVVLGCPGDHMLCRGCVRGSICPLDRHTFARVSSPQKPILKILGRLHVRCFEASSGCEWTGPRSNLDDHRTVCPYVEQECIVCGCVLRRSDARFVLHTHAVSEACSPNITSGNESIQSREEEPIMQRRLDAINRILDVYEQAERLNVCFLVDSTGSMGKHIRAVKDQINYIVHELRARLPSMRLHLAFVGYRDHCDAVRIEEFPFSSSVDDFKNFVAAIRATGGGGDGPEDVHGGLETVCGLDWAVGGAATKVLIHIADFPAHGREYNDCPGDSYPNGDPRGLELPTLVQRLQSLSVQYTFGHITDHTDKMVRVLNAAFNNYIESTDMRSVELMAEVVFRSLHTSVASTVSTLTTVAGSVDEVRVTLSDEIPEWPSLPADTVRLRYCRSVMGISELYADADPLATRRFDESTVEVVLAPLPFSQGETRVARHARQDGIPAVAKHFKVAAEGIAEGGDAGVGDGDVVAAPHLTLSEVSAVAEFLARQFSASRPEGERIRFLASASADGEHVVPFNLEEALPVADFCRYSNNIGWWERDASRVLMEFSRFTHEATKGHMMVVDLQGVKVEEGWLLTDPCVLCEDVERFGSGNLGPHAMDRCLATLRVRLDETPVLSPSVHAPAETGRHVPACAPALPWRPPKTAPITPEQVGLFTDKMIDTLVHGKQPGKLINLACDQINALVRVARDVMMRQPTFLELQAPVNIVGDIHGQFPDLLELFRIGGLPPDANYLMLGDYVDRGKQSLETICLLLAFKIKYPENFFLLRGNHECASICRIYGFYDECKRRYNIKLWKSFTDLFNCLPPAALIDERILCMHGGLSPELQSFDRISNLPRPSDVPDCGLLCDLLWADPDDSIAGWVENDRGVSMCFGRDIVQTFKSRLGIDMVARAHQVVEDGYEFFCERGLVTIFSAPQYCGEFDNRGAFMRVADDLLCSFTIMQPASQMRRK